MNQSIFPPSRPTCISLPLPPTPLATPILIPGSSRPRSSRRAGTTRTLPRKYEPGVSFFEIESEESEDEGNMLGLSFSDGESAQGGEDGFEFDFDFDGVQGSGVVDELEQEDEDEELARPFHSASRSTFHDPYSRPIPSCPSLSRSFNPSSQSSSSSSPSSSSSSAREGETYQFFPTVFDLTSPPSYMGSIKSPPTPLLQPSSKTFCTHISFLGAQRNLNLPYSTTTRESPFHQPVLQPGKTRSNRITLRTGLFTDRSDLLSRRREVDYEEGWTRRG